MKHFYKSIRNALKRRQGKNKKKYPDADIDLKQAHSGGVVPLQFKYGVAMFEGLNKIPYVDPEAILHH